MKPWYERFEERYHAELASFEKHGMRAEIDPVNQSRGILRLNVSLKHLGIDYQIWVSYPVLFPYFQPLAFLQDGSLKRHQHPTSGHLCLLGQGTWQWDVDDLFADILAERFPKIIAINSTDNQEQIGSLEEAQGEPYTVYFNADGLPDSAILYNTEWKIPSDVDFGFVKVRARPESCKPPTPIQGYVECVMDGRRNVLASWTGPAFDQHTRTMHFPWVRIEGTPPGTGPKLLDSLNDNQKRSLNLGTLNRKKENTLFFLIQEEACQFSYLDALASCTLYPSGPKDKMVTLVRHQRTFRAGDVDLAARMPGIRDLEGRSLLIFGLGALGAPVALLAAQAGIGKLVLCDYDFVDPGTVRRWPLGASAFGSKKNAALQRRIETDYPWTKVRIEDIQVGKIQDDGPIEDQLGRIYDLAINSDLILDATAETGVNHFLSAIARQVKKPYVVISGTPGIWGGYAANFPVEEGSRCWVCFQAGLYGETANIEQPPFDPSGMFQPPGCHARTFSGTGFDALEISIEAMRVVAGLLTRDYPSPSSQVSVLHSRDTSGDRVGPVWKSFDIRPRVGCSCAQ